MNLAFKPITLDMKTKQAEQQVPAGGYIGWQFLNRDFSGIFPCSGIRVIHKISVMEKVLLHNCLGSQMKISC